MLWSRRGNGIPLTWGHTRLSETDFRLITQESPRFICGECQKDRLTLKQGDFEQDEFGLDYDLIVSGLSTHHLNDAEKPGLYKRVYDALKPGGVFINREVVLGDSLELTNQYHHLWREYIRSNGEDDEKWFNKYIEEDIPAPVAVQTNWLQEIGFVDVGCHWRYLNFAVFGGRKP